MTKFNFSGVSAIFAQLPNIILIGLLIVGGLFAYREFKGFMTSFGIDLKGIKDARFDEQQQEIDKLNRQFSRIDTNVVRGQTNIVSSEEIEEMFEKTIDSRIQALVKQNQEQVVALGKAIASLSKNLEMDVTPYGQFVFKSRTGEMIALENTYVYADSQGGKRGIQLAQITFDHSDSTFTKYTDPLRLEATSVRAQQQTGNFNHYLTLEAFNPNDKIYKNKPYKFKIDTLLVQERKHDVTHWFFPNIHVEGGFGFGSNFTFSDRTSGFDIGLSLGGFGLTADDHYLRILRIGIGVSNNLDQSFGSISPIGLNLKTLRFIPFLKDTYIFPGLSFRKDEPLGFATSISTTF